MSKRPDLVVIKGELKGRHYTVGKEPLRLGRASVNDIHVPDGELSRNHCIFECRDGDNLIVTDLASANGTRVNGEPLGSSSRTLKEGDIVEAGSIAISVGEPPPPRPIAAPRQGAVDLGLDTRKAPGNPAAADKSKRRKPLANILWIVAVVVAAGAIFVILNTPSKKPPVEKSVSNVTVPTVREVLYEKVHGDAKSIYRYALTYSPDGLLSVKIDDTANGRHLPPKTKNLPEEAVKELNEMLAWSNLATLESSYTGLEPVPPALDLIRLKVVYTTGVREIVVSNTEPPDAFDVVRGKIEAFSKSELGVWAIAYSREKLIELSEEAVRLGRTKWEDRDVNYGNLAASIAAFEEALFYLETVDPKPECASEAREGLVRSKEELSKRYVDQRFRADKALNLSQWETAANELRVLLQMIPDRRDDRHRDARQKLVSAERNLKKMEVR